MATVTGYTAARMKAIEDTTVVDGEIVGDNLILARRDGVTINAGNVRGATGEPGISEAQFNAGIGDGFVTTGKIANLAVTEAKLAAGAVSSTKIQDYSIINTKLGSNAVITSKIADDAVTAAKIAAGAVGSSELATDSVTRDKIGDLGYFTNQILGNGDAYIGDIRYTTVGNLLFFSVGFNATAGYSLGFTWPLPQAMRPNQVNQYFPAIHYGDFAPGQTIPTGRLKIGADGVCAIESHISVAFLSISGVYLMAGLV
jgi:hypothetical protein